MVDHNSAPPIPDTMRTSAHYTYGDSSVLEIDELPVPPVTPRTVLVEVVSAAINPLDWHKMTGTPWLVRMQGGFRKPKQKVLGVDLAGRVVAVGDQVTDFKPGDEVIGVTGSCFAQYVAAPADKLVLKPAEVTFDEATGTGVAGITAIQGLRDKARLSAGQHVLINGASGGVGTAAIQMARHLGATSVVATTRSPAKAEALVRLGATEVVDTTEEVWVERVRDLTGGVDVIIDQVGGDLFEPALRTMAIRGRYVTVGRNGGKRAAMDLDLLARLRLTLIGVTFRTRTNAEALACSKRFADHLLGAFESGALSPVLDRTFPLDELPAAHAYMGSDHQVGKIVLVP